MRCGGSRTGTAALAVLLGGLLGLFATASAHADDIIDTAGQALVEDRLYVHPDAKDDLTEDELAAIADELEAARVPIYLAVLSDDALSEVGGDPATLIAEIQRAADNQAGTYVVIVNEVFVAGSTTLGRRATAIADHIAALESKPIERVKTFIDQVELASAPAVANGDAPDRGGEGNEIPGSWLLTGILVLAVGWLPLAWRRSRRQATDDLTQVRWAVEEDVGSLAAGFAEVNSQLRVAVVNPPARIAFAHALEAYERSRQAAARVRHGGDVRRVTAILEEGWYALAEVRTRLAGQPVPERRPPCLFDPRHGPAATYVDWSPRGSGPRSVPACQTDAIRLSDGLPPRARMVKYNGVRCAYWEAGRAFAQWAEGWHARSGPMALLTYLWGTPIGEAWDDPSLTTAESPFDGWREPV